MPTKRAEPEGKSLQSLVADAIRVRGARTHNLKNISVDIPKHQLVVITGLSGSGKSSLAFDTLYAEGQRRYVESLSAYARQFLQMTDKPDVDLIEGLSPAISIEQKATSHNPRSTVGTVTEIHDYLRLLFARVGDPHCPTHHIKLDSQTISQMVDHVLALPADTKLAILSPVVTQRKGEHVDVLAELRGKGFTRLRVNGALCEIDAVPKLAKTHKHSIDIVVDRVKVKPDLQQRLAESFETACREGGGKALVLNLDTQEEKLFSTRFACTICDFALAEMEPRLFSFNSPVGACPSCDGLGVMEFFDPKRIVVNEHVSLATGAIKGWDRRNHFYFQLIQALAKHFKFDVEMPWDALPQKMRDVVLYGSGEEELQFNYVTEKGSTYKRKAPFEGVIPNMERRYRETESSMVREELAKFRHTRECSDCKGARLKIEARHVTVGERSIHTLSAQPLAPLGEWFAQLALKGNKAQIAEKIIIEIRNRLRFLVNVGLNYLSLDRSAETLSGGEAQRIRLASQIGSGLTGVMYVLDEPSIGLHQRDNDRLLETLKHLRDLGNSVLVVEHDEDAIRAADYVIDMGVGAGVHGGEIVARGTPNEICAETSSVTGQYLSGAKKIAVPKRRRMIDESKLLTIKKASGNNLKSVTASFPLGLFTCVTGVSGSGKSTLVNDTLARIVSRHVYGSTDSPAEFGSVSGLKELDKIVIVDQSPIGRTPRSNPATYTGLFAPIRDLYAQVPAARERGYEAGRFSFNVKGGRCEACEGDGVLKVEMHFLPDVYVPCDVCHGKRYNRETLEIHYKGQSIAQVLGMTVEDAHAFFSAVPMIARKLQTLLDVGLGYIRLGQSATTLSGGEAQRVKLALELSKRDTGRTLYVLDEPTTGLHFADIELLLKVLNRLRDDGNTVVVIEHNLDVIKTADWVIDLGPEGGAGGGEIVATGTPEQIAANGTSVTGKYLRALLVT
jgi:excinuclease ABC subunit A